MGQRCRDRGRPRPSHAEATVALQGTAPRTCTHSQVYVVHMHHAIIHLSTPTTSHLLALWFGPSSVSGFMTQDIVFVVLRVRESLYTAV